MAYWQLALIALGVVWVLQAVGTWVQMRHYRQVMSGVAERWSDGYVGAGNARGTLGKGVIVVLVVDGGGIVRQLLVMEGRSVLAKFRSITTFDGKPLDALRDPEALAALGAAQAQAIGRAVEQIDRASAKADPAKADPASATPAVAAT